jgi:hypothetical protein
MLKAFRDNRSRDPSPLPSRAQLAEHALRHVTLRAWFEENGLPRNAAVEVDAAGKVTDPRVRIAMTSDRVLEAMLTLEVWRARLLGEWKNGTMPAAHPDEAARFVVAMSEALQLVFKPWWDGEARLNTTALVDVMPRLWGDVLQARGLDILPENHAWAPAKSEGSRARRSTVRRLR